MTEKTPFTVDIKLIFEGIKDGKWKDQVEEYRKTKDQSIKDNLPCYTVGGVFSPNKEIRNLKTASNLLSLDIDDFEGTLDALMTKLEPISPHIVHVSKSAGGRGYCVIVKIKKFKDYDHYLKIYYACYSLLQDNLEGCAKFDYLPNLNRLRFVSYDQNSLTFNDATDFEQELELPQQVEITEKGNTKKFSLGSGLSDEQKFEIVLNNFVYNNGDFGVNGKTRHDWILGIARWSCRADIDEGWLVNHLLINYQNSSRQQIWASEVRRCVRDSYRAYAVERGKFEPTKKFSYDDILKCSNVEEVREQVLFLISDKINYADYLESNKKDTTFVKKEIMFYKKLIEFL